MMISVHYWMVEKLGDIKRPEKLAMEEQGQGFCFRKENQGQYGKMKIYIDAFGGKQSRKHAFPLTQKRINSE